MKKLFSVLGASYAALCCMMVFGVTANAYIDPSVMTYVIQAVAGIVIAIGAGLGIWGVINLLEGYGNDNPGANAHVR